MRLNCQYDAEGREEIICHISSLFPPTSCRADIQLILGNFPPRLITVETGKLYGIERSLA